MSDKQLYYFFNSDFRSNRSYFFQNRFLHKSPSRSRHLQSVRKLESSSVSYNLKSKAFPAVTSIDHCLSFKFYSWVFRQGKQSKNV